MKFVITGDMSSVQDCNRLAMWSYAHRFGSVRSGRLHAGTTALVDGVHRGMQLVPSTIGARGPVSKVPVQKGARLMRNDAPFALAHDRQILVGLARPETAVRRPQPRREEPSGSPRRRPGVDRVANEHEPHRPVPGARLGQLVP